MGSSQIMQIENVTKHFFFIHTEYFTNSSVLLLPALWQTMRFATCLASEEMHQCEFLQTKSEADLRALFPIKGVLLPKGSLRYSEYVCVLLLGQIHMLLHLCLHTGILTRLAIFPPRLMVSQKP